MMKRRKRSQYAEAELDITAFMNLMIVLVPVLLLSFVFSHITAIDINLPEAGGADAADASEEQIELVIRGDYMRVDYPRGVQLKLIPQTSDGEQDFALLSLVLQEVKRRLREQGNETKAITILSEQDIDYQTIITAMDTVRSFEAVVAASVVDAALFPEISFGDAPLVAGGVQ
jgi:biopolymer transport protein ExbD